MSKSDDFNQERYSVLFNSPSDMALLVDSERINTSYFSLTPDEFAYPVGVTIVRGAVAGFLFAGDAILSVEEWQSLTWETDFSGDEAILHERKVEARIKNEFVNFGLTHANARAMVIKIAKGEVDGLKITY